MPLETRSVKKDITRNQHTPSHNSSSSLIEKLEANFGTQREAIISEFSAIVKESEERIMQRISDFAAEISNVKLSIAAVNNRVSAVESSCADIFSLRNELIAVQSELSELKNNAVAADIIINGLPQESGENLREVFGKICTAIEHTPPPLREAFRIRSGKDDQRKNNQKPVVVKLAAAFDRNQLFKSIAAFCKKKKIRDL